MYKINEEEIEVGKEILSYCGKCKADTEHIISVMEDFKMRKVTCRTCDAQHNYRKPKSLIQEKTVKEPVKKTKTASTRKEKTPSSKKWADMLANCDLAKAQAYNMEKDFQQSSIIRHPSFGIGFVTKKIGQDKIEVLFEIGMKLLANNYVRS